HAARGIFVRETQRLDIERSVDGVAIRAGFSVERQFGNACELANFNLHEPARALFSPECNWDVAAQRELEAAWAAGSHFRTAQSPAHPVDHANGKLDHIPARNLKRDLRFDRERFHGLDLADT